MPTYGTNPGPTKTRGGKRNGAGRPSKALQEIRKAAIQLGKEPSELIEDMRRNNLRAMTLLAHAMPNIIEYLVEDAEHQVETQKFLVQMYMRYIAEARPSTGAHETPLQALTQAIRVTVNEVTRNRGAGTSAVIEAEGFSVLKSLPEPYANGHSTRSGPD